MKELLKKIAAGGTAAVMMVGSQLTAFASGESESGAKTQPDYSYDWIKESGNGTFDSLTGTVKETGGSFYPLLMAIGVVGLLAIIIICGIKLAAAGSGKRAEAIEQMVWVFVGGIIIFGSVSIIGIVGTIGANLGS